MDKPDFAAIQASSRHGTRARYKAECRCDDCRAANTIYQRQRRAAQRSNIVEDVHPAGRGGWLAAVSGTAVVGLWLWAILRKAASG